MTNKNTEIQSSIPKSELIAALDQEGSFVEVPVLTGFKSNNIIGVLKIRQDALPPTPEFVVSIGYRTLESHDCCSNNDGIPYKPYVGKYILMSVSLVSDDDYIGYLKQIGKV